MPVVWRNAWMWPLAPLLLTAATIAGMLGRPARRTPGEVAKYLLDFLEDTGGENDWDDFTSVKIADPTLDQIRLAAELIDLPLTDDGRRKLTELLHRAQALAAQAAPP